MLNGKVTMNDIYAKGGNVTPLQQYQKPMKNPILVELLDHWEHLRAGRIAPLRSEIDPRQIENALEHAFILERQQTGDIRFRIAGMGLNQLMGMEVRSMIATSVVAPEARQQFTDILNQVFDNPEIVELKLTASDAGRPSLTADMLLLPMHNEVGETTRILGCLVANGKGHPAPNRFTILSRKVTRIIAVDAAKRPMQHSQPVAGFAEDRSQFTPQAVKSPSRTLAHAKPRDYLRLVKTDE